MSPPPTSPFPSKSSKQGESATAARVGANDPTTSARRAIDRSLFKAPRTFLPDPPAPTECHGSGVKPNRQFEIAGGSVDQRVAPAPLRSQSAWLASYHHSEMAKARKEIRPNVPSPKARETSSDFEELIRRVGDKAMERLRQEMAARQNDAAGSGSKSDGASPTGQSANPNNKSLG